MGAMINRASRNPHAIHRGRWPLACAMAAVVVLAFALFPAVMGPPPPPGTSAPVAATETGSAVTGVQDTCPPGDHCHSATVEQALPRVPIPAPSLIALVALVTVAWRRPRVPPVAREWWLPPGRRRALLQVFLI
jgi:hypothetical protein